MNFLIFFNFFYMIKKSMADKLIITFDEYTQIVEKLAIQIHNNFKPTVLVGIMRGAAPILDILSRILKLPIAYIVIQSYSGEGMEDKQGQLMFAREISSLASDKDFKKVLLIDDLSDTGLTLNKSIEWLKNYGPTKNFIEEVKTACLWKKKSSTFEPDFCPVRLNSDPWIVQPTEHYEELSIDEIIKRNK
jgi:hypoxanthine phosphoribosyltransferase